VIPDDVLRAAQAGNEAAFRILYYRTVDKTHGLVSRLLGPVADVPDVVQEVYVQVHRSIGAFRGESAFGTWLHRLAVHVACSHRRRQRPAPPRPSPSPHDAEARMVAREDVRRLYVALETLPEEKRVAFVLYELQGMTLQEIADLVDAPLQTVAARLRRARIALAAAFAAAESEARSVER
jgi:RNA polymerase sigma-70 factor, ECF subfamily